MKTGIVLFNLGGPENLGAVRGFLFNLFSDRAILNLPALLRYPLALLISTLRLPKATEIYQSIGGGSPLLEETKKQAEALERILGANFKCAIAMRYAAPRAAQAARELKNWGAEKIIFLPMYPQFSASTTGSSFEEAEKLFPTKPAKICCYPELSGFIEAMAATIKPRYENLRAEAEKKNLPSPRLLLSAHGLPEKMIAAGDPYAWQCEKSARAIAAALKIPDLDVALCYQSRIGPLKWIGPSTEEEIARAGAERRPLLIAPLAFTAENSETVYEIDQLYRALAAEKSCPLFAYSPCVGAHPLFIEALAALVKQAASGINVNTCPQQKCPDTFSQCACRN